MVYVIYHDKCTDGFGAAFIAWQKFKNQATYIPLNHYDPVPVFAPKSDLILLDFCFDRKTLLNLIAQGHNILVLDHHESAYQDIKDLLINPVPNLNLKFNLNQSGAEMAWHFFNPGQPLPDLFNHIRDRDLGLFHLPGTHEIIAALMTVPKEFNIWQNLTVPSLLERGKIIQEVQHQMMVEMCDRFHWAQIGQWTVPVVNATAWWSDITKILLTKFPQAPFAAAYYALDEHRTKWSLRSLPESSVNVAKISAEFGGGGHPHSAGFTAANGQIIFLSAPIKKVA